MSNASLLNTYPLSGASGRRRRLLALRSAAEFDADVQEIAAGSVDGFIPDWWNARRTDAPADAPADAAAVERAPETALDRIKRLVDDPAPRTWLFAGDRLGFGSKHAKRGWIEHFSDVIRGHLSRSLDVVLDTTTDEARCDRLLRNLDWRLLRFQPDVVVLIPGPGEVSQLGFDATRLHDTLTALVERLREEGCEVVLCTLPPLRSTSDELSDRLTTLAEHVRQVGIATQSVLVDHADRWRSTAEIDPAADRSLDKSGTRPTQHGHQKLARNLIRTLELPLQ